MSDEEKVSEAGLNEAFICRVCAKVFTDRGATKPTMVRMKDCVVQKSKIVPHEKYPNDKDLAIVLWEDHASQQVTMPAADAIECCAAHTVLVNSSHLRFRQEDDGTVHIIGAEHLE